MLRDCLCNPGNGDLVAVKCCIQLGSPCSNGGCTGFSMKPASSALVPALCVSDILWFVMLNEVA